MLMFIIGTFVGSASMIVTISIMKAAKKGDQILRKQDILVIED